LPKISDYIIVSHELRTKDFEGVGNAEVSTISMSLKKLLIMHDCVISIHPEVNFYLHGYCFSGDKPAEITFSYVMLANACFLNEIKT